MPITIRLMHHDEETAQVIIAGGTLAPEAAARLRRSLASAAEDHRRLVVDLSQIREITSDALGALAEAAAELRWKGGDLAVVALGAIAEHIEGAGFAQALNLAKDASTACKLIGS